MALPFSYALTHPFLMAALTFIVLILIDDEGMGLPVSTYLFTAAIQWDCTYRERWPEADVHFLISSFCRS